MLLVYLKRRCYPLFSSKFLIGQLYSNWPGSSSRTVNQMEANSITSRFFLASMQKLCIIVAFYCYHICIFFIFYVVIVVSECKVLNKVKLKMKLDKRYM